MHCNYPALPKMLVAVVLFFLTPAGALWSNEPYGVGYKRLGESTSITSDILNATEVGKNDDRSNWSWEMWIRLLTLQDVKRKSNGNVCLTGECFATAYFVLQNMDNQVDPCDNFYEFACGNFHQNIPDDKDSVSSFGQTQDVLVDILRIIVEEPLTGNESRPFKLVKQFFSACMDEPKIEQVGLSHIRQLVHRLGGWPVLEGDGWDDNTFSWQDTVYRLKDEGFSFNFLIDLSVSPDNKDTTKNVIYIDQPPLDLARNFLVKGIEETFVQALYKYMVDTAVMFGADHDRAANELKEAVHFEMQLAKISKPVEDIRDENKLYNPTTLTQLEEKLPSIRWVEYASTILKNSENIQPDEVVIVKVPTYFMELEKLLRNTPKRIQANYMVWRAVESVVPYLTTDLRKVFQRFAAVTSGVKVPPPRWRECVSMVESGLYLAVGSMYVQRYVKTEDKQFASEMVTRIREETFHTLEEAKWMDDVTRRNALNKAKKMISNTAYPDELLDIRKLQNFYQKLKIRPDNYLEAALNMSKFQQDYSFSRLRKPVVKPGWVEYGHVTQVDAEYSEHENSINIYAGILQRHFFSENIQYYMNYGGIGWVIGHEITHGFDDEGRRFDKDGNLVDWWTPMAKEAFLMKASCFIDQYGNYTAEQVNMKLNGVNTQGENIADNGGLKLAYRAYTRWAAEHGAEQRLPGLQQFTPQQMFWISAANTRCTNIRSEALIQQINTDPHSPGMFRGLVPFSNIPEFAKDFKCPSGSKMNPLNKCQMW